ncbi:6-hydroxytryprostatin B O-methyltransferase [Acrasis kona]|uniref:6-hydroxytryprostatin B O-methyltransferase n=1 Tax=Acrasis kona TaxID=1008807 RepID=A0AAW2ZDV2_9EUKA
MALVVHQPSELSTLIATCVDWSTVTSFVDLGGDLGHTALHVVSHNENICKVAVMEEASCLNSAVRFAPQLRKQYGERNFNKLFYVAGLAHSTELPRNYDLYLLRDNRSCTSSSDVNWNKMLANVSSLVRADKKTVIIVTQRDWREMTSALVKLGLRVQNTITFSQGYIIEAQACN